MFLFIFNAFWLIGASKLNLIRSSFFVFGSYICKGQFIQFSTSAFFRSSTNFVWSLFIVTDSTDMNLTENQSITSLLYIDIAHAIVLDGADVSAYQSIRYLCLLIWCSQRAIITASSELDEEENAGSMISQTFKSCFFSTQSALSKSDNKK